MQDFSLGHGISASVNIGNGNLVASQTDVSLPTVGDPFNVSRSYNSRGAGKLIWLDDAVPYNATQNASAGSWTWDTSQKWSGTQSHKLATAAGHHWDLFYNSQARQFIPYGSSIVTYVYVDGNSPTREIFFQFNAGDGSGWEHRAYWGENTIVAGIDGTSSRRRVGDLPPTGQWVRLEIPAADVGLEGKVINGMAYSIYDGQAWFDKTYLGGGPLGYGWTASNDLAYSGISYTRLVERTDNAHVELQDSTGATRFFYPNGQPNQYASESEDFATATRQTATSEWELKTADGTRFYFDLSSGALKRIQVPERTDVPAFTYTYTGGRLTAMADPIGRRVLFFYDSEGHLYQVKAEFDGSRLLASYAYDDSDQLTSVTDAEGHTTKYSYDATNHDLIGVQSPRGAGSANGSAQVSIGVNVSPQASFSYGARLANEEFERISSVNMPSPGGILTTEPTTGFSYDTAARKSQVTLPRGHAIIQSGGDSFTWSYEYNTQGSPTKVTDPAGNFTSMAWNSANMLTAATDRMGATSTNDYDGNGNLCRTTMPVNSLSGQPAKTQYFYDEFAGAYSCSAATKPVYNLRTKTVDPEGRTTTSEYRDPGAGKPWVTKQITGAGTPDVASTTNSYYENTTSRGGT